jgi:1-phosphatidylinositol phosphodiesterase
LRELRGPCGAVLLDFCDDDDWALVQALVACNDHAPASGERCRSMGC